MIQAVAVLVIVGYPLIGVGLLGGWRHWDFRTRVRYCAIFPVHALLASLVRDVWSWFQRMIQEP